MFLTYDDQEDILFIKFIDRPVIQDVSYSWNINIGFTDKGIGQITILDAKEYGLMPIEFDTKLQSILYDQYFSNFQNVHKKVMYK
ncbi:hypothetical protein MHK_008207 [Candidatus Magnetomorum sp. HK-1]|uniref:DUF2283 domain-containing protein n=1 Tax=Candidatus Magnetoglobus multicellularis str. Araruama TaxID=890399 RepID=A0A1V1NT23_9BACT|nr:MAG: hypothetical protein OMM_13831 [Candidatus Magnetoglobus multicellularis str. Araruama]KPA11583.1 hypothetical protein MHK_008207 [Candidatus Magnetomorum sp. HK-1]